jgi:hypothetical protein
MNYNQILFALLLLAAISGGAALISYTTRTPSVSCATGPVPAIEVIQETGKKKKVWM